MRKHLASVLRLVADRLDPPPPVNVWRDLTSTVYTSAGTANVVWHHSG